MISGRPRCLPWTSRRAEGILGEAQANFPELEGTACLVRARSAPWPSPPSQRLWSPCGRDLQTRGGAASALAPLMQEPSLN